MSTANDEHQNNPAYAGIRPVTDEECEEIGLALEAKLAEIEARTFRQKVAVAIREFFLQVTAPVRIAIIHRRHPNRRTPD